MCVLLPLSQLHIPLQRFQVCRVFFAAHSKSAQQPKVNPDYLRESDVNANDWGQAGTFRLMLICLRVAARTPCTSIWSLTSKDKQWCKSAHPQSMSFLEVIPPPSPIHFLATTAPHRTCISTGPGRLGRNRELGNQIYWHFFKGDSWWKDRGIRQGKCFPHSPASRSPVQRGLLCLDCINPSVSTCYRAFINVVF